MRNLFASKLIVKTLVFVFTLLFAVGFPVGLPLLVQAEDNGSGSTPEIQTTDNQQEDIQKEEQDVEEADQEEGDIHTYLEQEHAKTATITLQEISFDQLTTYGDVLSALKNIQDALNQLKSNVDSQSQPPVALNDQERALFEKLLSWHHTDFEAVNTRIADAQKQTQELIDLLTPLASQNISASFGIKNLLFLTVKDFKEEIGQLGDLLHLDVNEIDAETL